MEESLVKMAAAFVVSAGMLLDPTAQPLAGSDPYAPKRLAPQETVSPENAVGNGVAFGGIEASDTCIPLQFDNVDPAQCTEMAGHITLGTSNAQVKLTCGQFSDKGIFQSQNTVVCANFKKSGIMCSPYSP